MDDLCQIGLILESNLHLYRRGSSSSHSPTLNYNLLSAIYCAGLYPQVTKILQPPKKFMEVMGSAVERDREAKEMKFYIPKSSFMSPESNTTNNNNSGYSNQTADYDILTENMARVFIHPSSINFQTVSFNSSSNYVLYGEKQIVQNNFVNSKSSAGTGNQQPLDKIYLKDTSEVTSFALLLFGGVLSYDREKGLLLIDSWISFVCSERVAKIFLTIRKELDSVLSLKLNQMNSNSNNNNNTINNSEKNPFLQAVRELLETSLV
jgi:ATP-dependent RNA helicase DHX57